MKRSNFASPRYEIGEQNTKIVAFFFLNLDNERYGPKENFAKICQMKWIKLNKIGEVWNSANRLLSNFIGLLSSKNFATIETWRNCIRLHMDA